MINQLYSKKMAKDYGFSLIEILVVIAIVGVIASIGIPSFLRARTDAKLRGAASNLKGDLELAKMRAIRENAYVVILFEESGYLIWVDNGSLSGNWEMEDDEILVRNRDLPEGVYLEMDTPFPGNLTRFVGRGVSEDDGDLVLRNNRGKEKTVNINRLGKISMQ